ncbi:MAG: CbiX/SirB N-terminal domain-containing protein [Verrucomicrobiales bacterium]
MEKPEAALILIGHGSTENPDSSAPTYQHADAIRDRGIFREVVCAFWKEEPSLREVYWMVDSRDVYVVPNFISEGYFTRQVIPRELRLEGSVSEVAGKRVRYCDPVGIHPSMTRLILHRAGEVAPGIDPGETSLIIVGHGTKLNAKSTEAIKAQVELIAEGGYGYAEVIDAYMEEAPFIAKWDELAKSPNVVVVPFFIADGLHSYQDIPVMLGIESELTAAASEREVFRENPYSLRGRTLFYSSAVGTDSLMPEVILDQVEAFDEAGARAETKNS